jgi:hypothetical protein
MRITAIISALIQKHLFDATGAAQRLQSEFVVGIKIGFKEKRQV